MRCQWLLLPFLALSITATAFADEGMWTYHDFPSQLVKQKYGADITQAWLERARLATVRLSNCTASFVSPNGLMLTNHHCAAACAEEHSTSGKSILKDGFLARRRDDELRCGTQIADVLFEMENITDKVNLATRGLDDRAANDARKKALTQLEQACEQSSLHGKSGPLKCESVSLYEGGQFWLYKYKRYSDVRLVFVPEIDIAAFGGDPDNFQFPRWCLDMSLLRAYDANGKSIATPHFLQINPNGPDAGSLVFVSGHPGSTDRMLTVSQLVTLRDIDLPPALLRNSELRGRYIQYGKTSAEAERLLHAPREALEKSLKVRRGQLDARSPGPRKSIARSRCPTASWKPARASTAGCSTMRACWFGLRPSGPSQARTDYGSIATRHCPASSSKSQLPSPFTLSWSG
jgi:hypothetical protein